LFSAVGKKNSQSLTLAVVQVLQYGNPESSVWTKGQGLSLTIDSTIVCGESTGSESHSKRKEEALLGFQSVSVSTVAYVVM
jgi:hypothetical protein